jgi:hypothetical protein
MWFRNYFGLDEKDWKLLRWNEASGMLESPSGAQWSVGSFEVLSVHELHRRIGPLAEGHRLKFGHIVGDVRTLHRDPDNWGSVFQAASQFNCLEMTSPSVTPSAGISIYENDPTQGPACAMSCPAAIVFRNYFYNGGQLEKQLDMLDDLGEIVDNPNKSYWRMVNGYCLPTSPGSIRALSDELQNADLWNRAYNSLKVGIHWSTEVNARGGLYELPGASIRAPIESELPLVCQVFCSGLPVAYSRGTSAADFEVFARLVLQASFDATLAAAGILALKRCCRVKVFLTMLGGGVFGNKARWIVDALTQSLFLHRQAPLDVFLVHYGSICSDYLQVRYDNPAIDSSESNY